MAAPPGMFKAYLRTLPEMPKVIDAPAIEESFNAGWDACVKLSEQIRSINLVLPSTDD